MTMTVTNRPVRRRGAAASGRGPAGFTLLEMIIVIGVILLLTALTVTVITGLSARAEVRDTENTMRIMEQALSEWELSMSRQVTYGRSGNFKGMSKSDNEPFCGDYDPHYEIPQLVEAKHNWGLGTAGENKAGADALRTSDMLWSIVSRASSPREIIARINPEFVVELDPASKAAPPVHFEMTTLGHLDDYMNGRLGYRFMDAWGTPILAVMPGQPYSMRCPDATMHDASKYGYVAPDPDGTIRTPFENRFGIAANRRIFFVSAGPSGRFGNLFLDRTAAEMGTLSDQERRAFHDASDNIFSQDISIEDGRPK